MSLTDSRRMWVMLRDAGREGCHSHDLRARGISGNPSQRAKDIVSHGQAVWTAREARNGRPGSRYWLADDAPDWAVPVKPNGTEPSSPHNGSQSAVQSPASPPRGAAPAEPLALVLDFTGDHVRDAETLPNGTRVYYRRAA